MRMLVQVLSVLSLLLLGITVSHMFKMMQEIASFNVGAARSDRTIGNGAR